MAERREAARKRRQTQAAVGAGVALLLIAGGVFWAVTAFSGDDGTTPAAQPTDAAAPEGCVWVPDDPAANPDLQDVGTPPPGEPRSGVSTMTITTNQGVVEVAMDHAAAPCTAASFTYLAAQEFYDGSICHRMTTEGIYVLQCGDPTGTGRGGPTYKYAEENLPVGVSPSYPKGTVAMAKTQAPSTTGSQFFIVYQDTELPPDYTIVGTVTEGMDVIEAIAAEGAVDPEGQPAADGAPKTEVVIETLRVGDRVDGPAGGPTAGPTVAPTAEPTG
jgi:peptidyl-prolyl cis-trans isomerase B (cyclophilin B)